MAFTDRRIWKVVGVVAVVVILLVTGLMVRSVLRSRARLAQGNTARRPPVPQDPPRLDVRERSQLTASAPALDPLLSGAPLRPDGGDALSFARSTADEYRQRARYPRWSQPLQSAEDPLVRDWAASPVSGRPDAELTGNYRDARDGGDLAVDAEIDVAANGRFHIEATLYSADGQRPIAWAQHTAELSPGRQWFRLRFYGLILRERGIDGPYLVRCVALSTLSQTATAKNRLAQNAYVTTAYTATTFTDRPFDDPDLLEAADRIEQVIEGLATDAGS